MFVIRIKTQNFDRFMKGMKEKVRDNALAAAASAVYTRIYEHFRQRQTEPRKDGFPAQGFWVGNNGNSVAERMTRPVIQGGSALIGIDSPALAHKLNPSPPPIRPGAGKKYLTLAAISAAAGKPARDAPVELHFKRLLEGDKKGMPVLADEAGNVWYYLARKVKTPHDPDALPSDDVLMRTASDEAQAATAYFSQKLSKQ